MSTGPRNKERSYEHETELVKLAEERGLEAKRAWGSNGRSMGWTAGVDVVVEGQPVQAKRYKGGKRPFPKWFRELLDYLGECRAVAFRQDREENYVLMKYSDYLCLLEKNEKSSKTSE